MARHCLERTLKNLLLEAEGDRGRLFSLEQKQWVLFSSAVQIDKFCHSLPLRGSLARVQRVLFAQRGWRKGLFYWLK